MFSYYREMLFSLKVLNLDKVRAYGLSLDDYCSILLLSYSICSGSLESPVLLPPYSIGALALRNTTILIITLTSFNP